MTSQKDLVSVICLAYNQRNFVKAALQSILYQTYENIEIIIVDDASTDGTGHVIQEFISKLPAIKFFKLTDNVGNCKAFNLGLTIAKGKYIVDLAADDVMFPERIERQVLFFSQLDPAYGVVFTDVTYINEKGVPIRNHFEHLMKKKLIKKVPEGNVFSEILSRYFVSAPSMMIKREVMEALNGYDETLEYEDFDFWVRSSRLFKYGFLNERLTYIRRTQLSKSTGWYKRGDKQLHSTYLICKKAMALIQNEEEHKALSIRVSYEYRQSLFSGNKSEGALFAELLHELNAWSWSHTFWYLVSLLPFPWIRLRNIYQYVFYG
ncbi:MAG: glycosyltransferase [Cyclobacteriaceae bacterium]|nr:glycosyltransferase [Cyclobacteriaceae bacterium]